ncbi:methyl-accepting chemotaxis protein [Pseudoprimorskyibacter insulae]|uniref:Methyl-accepting chemotaxis protein McpH n=1 Tax=Pseudoprimorskyibacter insulae TaxID=1695997 RepID=A0A2R8AVM5_9RHOB|nr:methyl-accepting chemotaxis protein [Pseudoprimorskyibacter insulae]SPF80050.1 Methyl-accepting chemotaxis protein McpH [Pseudoprimorskyibacter insulae]
MNMMPFNDDHLSKDELAQRQQAIKDIALRIGNLSVAIVGVSGEVSDTAARVDRQAEIFRNVGEQANQIAEKSQTVLHAADSAVQVSEDARTNVTHTSDRLTAMVGDVADLIDRVSQLFDKLEGLDSALKSVSAVSREVENISRKTNLLSLNASIEAARAGPHGRGFMVVAQEVKDLSTMTGDATAEIQETISELSVELSGLIDMAKGAVNLAGGIRSQTDGIGTEITAIPETLSGIASAQRDILSASSEINTSVDDVRGNINDLRRDVEQSSESLGLAQEKMASITEDSEAITSMTARLGVETPDTKYISAVQQAAEQVSAEFERAVQSGRVSMHDLFDTNYTPIAGTNPQQVMARFTEFTDAILPVIQEPMLDLAADVVFCAAVNVDGYLPTHNRKFSMPQMPSDPGWNASYSRNRRIFNDRVGLAAGKSKRPFLLQAYRRDMGNGTFILMKDVSAPIVVKGRHWGGLRLAYKA